MLYHQKHLKDTLCFFCQLHHLIPYSWPLVPITLIFIPFYFRIFHFLLKHVKYSHLHLNFLINVSWTIVTLIQKKAYWLRGTPRLLDKSQRLWYNACPQCHKSFRGKPAWKIVCTSCNKQVNITARCRLTVELADYSGVLTLDLYDNDALQLLPFTLSEMQDLENKVTNLVFICIQNTLTKN